MEEIATNYIGKEVYVKIDRPIGSSHPKYPDHIYLVNYGYVPNTISGDGKELDCYVLGEYKPLMEYTGTCIAVIRRLNDDDDKLIIAPKGKNFTDNEIRLLTDFQEMYYESEIIRIENISSKTNFEIYLEKVNLEDKEILYRLLQYSLFEESLTDGNEMTNEAIFEYKYFDRYFTEDNREAFFIKDNETNKLMGFVMINTYLQVYESGHSIAEFMVIPKYRRNKIGKQAALKCFDMHKGNWEVSPSLGSNTAFKFWKNVIDDYTKEIYSFNNKLFTFNNENL